MRDLAPVVDRWPEAARVRFEERAAIREFDGGMTRAQAEREAEQDVRRAWKAAQDQHRRREMP